MINVANSIKYIDHYAFRSCENLKSITIPNSVKIIGDSAFEFCNNLIQAELPKNIDKTALW